MSKKEERFCDLILVHEGYLLNFIFKELNYTNYDLAVELKQNTLEKAWKNFDQMKEESNAKSWFFSIAVNEMKLYQRRESLNQKYNYLPGKICDDEGNEVDLLSIKENDVEQDEVAARIIEKETIEELRKVISELGEPYRKILQLRFFAGLSLDEIEKETGMKKNSVGVSIYRGIQKVRKKISADTRECGSVLEDTVLMDSDYCSREVSEKQRKTSRKINDKKDTKAR